MTDSNFRTYIADTYAFAFDENLGILVVQNPNPLTTLSLRRQFRLTIMRTSQQLDLPFHGVPVHEAQFQSRR
jgi:hypothetical protein